MRAILKSLSDEDLVVAQGLENAPREDLSFIERAIFAMRIEDAGHKRSVVQDALAIDRAEASKLIAVAKAIPTDIIEAVGKAPKIGRGRWQTLADLLADTSALKRTRAATSDTAFGGRESDDRFLVVFNAATKQRDRSPSQRARVSAVSRPDGQRIAQIQRADRELKLSLDKKVPVTFADFLVDQLPGLFDAFMKANGDRRSPRPNGLNRQPLTRSNAAKEKGPRNGVPEALL